MRTQTLLGFAFRNNRDYSRKSFALSYSRVRDGVNGVEIDPRRVLSTNMSARPRVREGGGRGNPFVLLFFDFLFILFFLFFYFFFFIFFYFFAEYYRTVLFTSLRIR